MSRTGVQSVRTALLGTITAGSMADPTGVTTGTSQGFDARDYLAPALYVIGAGTISSGTLILETADSLNYSGTWSPIYTVTCSDVSAGKQKYIGITGPNGYGFLRVRLSVDVGGGGTVAVILRAGE